MSDSTQEHGNNALKRKNEDVNNDVESLDNSTHNKRIALDSEQLEKNDEGDVPETTVEGEKGEGGVLETTVEGDEKDDEKSGESEGQAKEEEQHVEEEQEAKEENDNDQQEKQQTTEEAPKTVSKEEVEKFLEEAALLTKLSQPAAPETQPQEETSHSTPNQKEQELDPSYVSFRMYCPVKEAGTIVGKQGAKINHLREKADVKILISDNIKNVPERIITVKGTAENVAKAFGLIVRTILGEPEDTPADLNSQQYNLKLLIPNAIIGFVIGKQGLKFREIEENSAAKLKAAEHPLAGSTDRVLSVLGVADAIHIAVYFIAEVIIEHKDALQKAKVILYNPANHHQQQPQQQSQHLPPHQQRFPNIPQGANQYGNPIGYQKPFQEEPHQPYNFSMMFQPSTVPQQQYGMPQQQMAPPPPLSQGVPPQQQYTDEYNNTLIGEVIIKEPVLAGDKYNQDLFVANSSIGSVIGRGGNNIKHIRENSGCTYVKIEPDRGQSIMLGNGRGLTNIRRLTLTGSLESFQKAIYLINQRINADRERNIR
ncbi:PBP2 [Candida metapsilosis]|uniref:PBP2 n=1 Tax=Candida metapsilosis TaxID=273372 RepID=A0A8H7ZJB0_9ASCO|nr:PBP2 [Candida metapsilosis]